MQRVGRGDHLAHHVEIAAGIVGDRQIEDALAVAFDQQVVDDLLGRAAFARRAGGDAVLGRRFVVRRIAQRIHAIPALDPLGAPAALERLGQDAGAELGMAQLRPAARERQMGDLLVARPAHERVLRQLEPEQHAGRARAHLGGDPQALVVGLVDLRHQLAPAVGTGVGLQQADGDGAAGFLRQAAEQADLVVLVLEVRDDLHPAGAGIAHGVGDRRQLGFLGAQGRDVLAVGRAVVERARGREAERAGAQAFGRELGHAPAILLGRRLAVGAALAHHIDAQRGVRHLGGDVDVVAAGGDRIEEVREAVPVPRQAFGQHDLGDVLHALHQVDQHVVLVGVAGREADAAIAEQHGGDAVPGRGRQPVAPGHLRIVVGVDVDEARRDQLAARVDLLGALGDVSADRGDLAVGDGEVGFVGIAAGAIDDGAVADHEAGRRHAGTPRRGLRHRIGGEAVGAREAGPLRLVQGREQSLGDIFVYAGSPVMTEDLPCRNC